MGVSERSSKTMRRPVRAVSAKESAHADHASHEALRPLILPTPRPCFIAPSATMPLYSTTVSQALRQTLRGEVPKGYPPAPATTRPRGCGGGTEDVEVGH